MAHDQVKGKFISLKTLDPETYRLWVSLVSHILTANNLLKIVTGEEQKPIVNQRSINSWENRNAWACEALLNALQNSELIKVQHLQNAKDIWDRLAEEFGNTSEIKYAQAEAQLRSLIKPPRMSIKDHINKFTKLKEARDFHAPENFAPLTTEQVNLAFITSLGNPWKLFHQALGDNLYTMRTGELFAKVEAMDSSFSMPNQQSETDPRALTVSNKTNYNGTKKKRYHPYSNDDKNSDSSQTDSDPNKDFDGKGRCRYCHQYGHGRTKCYKKMWSDTQFTGKKSRDDANKNNDKDGDQEYQEFASVMCYIPIINHVSLDKQDDTEWIINSAFNANLTSYWNRLKHYQKFNNNGIIKGLGGKQVAAQGIGSVTLTNNQDNKYIIKDVLYISESLESIISLMKLRKSGFNFQFLNDKD